MNELVSIDNEYQRIKNNLKENKKDLKVHFEFVENISNLINRINNRSENVIINKKKELIDIYLKEKKRVINDIINLSYIYFMDEDESVETDYKSLIMNIQQSSFYEECKDNCKLKEMEINYIMIEAEENNDYSTALGKLEDMKKIIFDYKLKAEIENDIEECRKGISNNKKKEISKLLKENKFDEAINQFINILEDKNLFQYIYKEYAKTLEYLIQMKIKAEAKEIPEIKIYKDFIINNKDRIKNHKRYLKKLSEYEVKSNFSKEKDIEEIDNIDLIFRSKNQIQIDRKDVDDYLYEIEKKIPEEELEEFDLLKDFIYQQIINFDNEANNNYINTRKWIKDRKSYINELMNINNIGRIYSYLNLKNKICTGYNIYTIQLISLLVLSQKLPNKTKGIFCKINTGEGKSTIIQLFAAYQVFKGNKVDIISSSPVLAERDATEPKRLAFFESLNITVGFVKGKIKPYNLDIVYGDSTSFCADILLEEYEFTKTRNGRGFDIVIIDEVDNMCIDNLASKTQLTKKFSGYQSLYTFYYTIILCFNFIANEMKLTCNPAEIEKNRNIIKKSILQKLKDNPIDLEKGITNDLDVMAAVDQYIYESKNKKNKKNQLEESTSSNEKKENEALEKLLTQDGKIFEVDGKNVAGILYPNCLKEEIENHIENWIDSVITAFTMVENIDYRIIKQDNYNSLVPIDVSNTGVTQNNMVWHDALHQVLQILNDVELFPENLNTNFLYIITFFKKYKQLFGLTGTIGSETNQLALKNLYKVNLFFIPPNLKSQLKKRSEMVFTDESKWEGKIISEIKEVLEENRAVLLICRSIKEGEYFLKLIKDNGINSIKKYFIEENKSVVDETLNPKTVIIATNLAGRGTDIKLSRELQNSGGLHVIVSFLPINQRVEEQNYGRAGRNGQKGSYSLLFVYLADMNNPFLTVDSIKKKREKDEREKFENFKKYDEQKMKEEEELFKDNCEFRNILHKRGDEFIKEDKEYYWGKILNSKMSFEQKKNELKKLKQNDEIIINPLIKIKYFIENIDKFKEKDEIIFEQEKFYSWPLKMRYANILAENKQFDKAREYYEEVIESLGDYQIDIQNQTVIDLLIFKSLAKNEKSKIKDNKTKISLQNERKKNFIQAIIDIAKENIDVLKAYDALEETEISYIEEDKIITIEDICKKIKLSPAKNKDEIKDLKVFSLEFGIEKFSLLRIVTKPNFWKNNLVIAIGVIEIAVSGVICYFGVMVGNTKLIDFSLFLVKQGFNDILEAFQSALEGKEMNLWKWGCKKLVEYTKGIIKVALGNSSFAGSVGDMLINKVKDEIISITTSYAIEKASELAYNELLTKGGNRLQEYCNSFIGQPILKKILKKTQDKKKYFVMDLVNEEKLFKSHLVRETDRIFGYISTYSKVLKKLKRTFEKVRNEKSGVWKAIQIVFDSVFIIKDLYPSLKDLFTKLKNGGKIIEDDFIPDTRGKFKRFDGSLKTLVEIEYQTYEDDSKMRINQICQEMVKYNVIDKSGKFDLKQIQNEELEQEFFIKINDEFRDIIPSNKKLMESSVKLLDFDNKMKSDYIKYLRKKSFAFGKRNIEAYKKEISEELTRTVFKNVKFIFDELMAILLKKFRQKVKEFRENNRKKEELKLKTENDIKNKFLNFANGITEKIKKPKKNPPIKTRKNTDNKTNKTDNQKTTNTGKKEPIVNIKPIIKFENTPIIKKEINSKTDNKEQIKSEIEKNPDSEKELSNTLNSENKKEEQKEEKKEEPKEEKNNNSNINKDVNEDDDGLMMQITGLDPEEYEELNGAYKLYEPNLKQFSYINENNENNNVQIENDKNKNELSDMNNINEKNNKVIDNNNENKQNIIETNNNNDSYNADVSDGYRIMEEEDNNDYLRNRAGFYSTSYNYIPIYSGIDDDIKQDEPIDAISSNDNNNENKQNIIETNNNNDSYNADVSYAYRVLEEEEENENNDYLRNRAGFCSTSFNYIPVYSGIDDDIKNDEPIDSSSPNDDKKEEKEVNNDNKLPLIPYSEQPNQPTYGRQNVERTDERKEERVERKDGKKNDTSEKDRRKKKIKKNFWKDNKDNFFKAFNMFSENIDIAETVGTCGNWIIDKVFQKLTKNRDFEVENLDEKNKNKILKKKVRFLEDKKYKKLKEQYSNLELKNKGRDEWIKHKNNIIEKKLNEINYMYIIDESLKDIYFNFRQSVEGIIQKIFDNSNNLNIKCFSEKYMLYFHNIKNDIPEIQTLNLITAGFTGSGKSCLTNVLLKKDLSEEGHSIYPKTNEIKLYKNLDEVPGLAIYDTIGVENSNANRNITEIKKMIKETFNKNIKEPQKSLHGILYCIKNGSSEMKILDEEINYIKELNNLYGDDDILIIVFTQSLNAKSEERKEQLRKELNNNNIKIIDVLAKDKSFKIRNNTFTAEAFGINDLINCIAEKCQKTLVKCNLKQIAKSKIKDKFYNDIKNKLKDIIKKIRNFKVGKNISDELKFIIRNIFGDLNLNFEDLEKFLDDYMDNMVKTILERIKNIYIGKMLDTLNEEFIIINAKYNNTLETNLNLNEIFKIKIDKFFGPKIKEELNRILEEKIMIIFLEKTRTILSEKISENIKDDDIKELANSNVNKILEKIKK